MNSLNTTTRILLSAVFATAALAGCKNRDADPSSMNGQGSATAPAPVTSGSSVAGDSGAGAAPVTTPQVPAGSVAPAPAMPADQPPSSDTENSGTKPHPDTPQNDSTKQ